MCSRRTAESQKEVIGALIYPVRACDPNDADRTVGELPRSRGAGIRLYNASQAYETIISEIRGGTERKFLRGGLPPGRKRDTATWFKLLFRLQSE